MKNCDEMVDSLFERRELYIAAQNRKRKVLIRAAAAVSCVCVAVLLGFGVLLYKNDIFGNDANRTDIDLPIISSFDADGLLPSYPTPKNGELHFTLPLGGAMEKYGEDALYHVYLQVFENGEVLPTDSQQVKEEAERLSDSGYNVTYEASDRQGIALYAKLNEIKEFDVNENYGYFMFLYDECGETDLLYDII